MDLFHCTGPLQIGEDKRRFRVRHHEEIETIDAMVMGGEIREYQERYRPALLALTTLTDHEVLAFLGDCDAVFSALRARYLVNYVDPIAVDELAAQSGMDAGRFRRALGLLNEDVSVIAVSQGNHCDPDHKVSPAERVLTLRSFANAVFELQGLQSAFGGGKYFFNATSEELLGPVTAKMTTNSSPRWIVELPDDLGALLNEIHKARLEGLLALPVMGVRAAIDMACSNLVGDIGGFEAKLKELAKLGHVSEAQRRTLSAVIDLGHASAHRGHIPDSKDVDAIIDILERLLKSLYLDSETVDRLKLNTPSRGRGSPT